MRMIEKGAWVIGVIAACATSACDDGGDDGRTTIEVKGSWTSEFGDEDITETHWNGFCVQAIARFDNDDNVAVLETLSGDGCGTGFSRVVWLEPAGDTFHYCVTAFGAESADAAAGAPEVGIDRAALTTGCSGFGWSKLTRR
ncbi:MAG: hypothetical protein IT385_08815 [Deltaproteobacteria bacterium]|nr:hypothetical protein [Deltaproteobacteria bacterium]